MNIKGQNIKCVSNLHAPELVVGKVYTVGEARMNTVGVWQVEVGGKWYAQHRFELTKEREMKQQFYVGDVVEVVQTEEENWYRVGDKFVVSGWNDGNGALPSDPLHVTVEGEEKYAWVLAKDLKISSRAWQKNTGEQPVDGNAKVEVKFRTAGKDKYFAGGLRWVFQNSSGDIVGWRLADDEHTYRIWCDTCEGSGEIDETLGGIPLQYARHDAPCPDCSGKGWWEKIIPKICAQESIPPVHVALGDELVPTDVTTEQEWTDKHYDSNYVLTQKDIERGFIKIDPYFVSKMWKIGSKDDSGALWHCFKTIARFGEKNSREREIKALYAQIKCLAELENVSLGEE